MYSVKARVPLEKTDAIFSPVPHFSTISKKDRHAKLYQMLLIDQGKLYWLSSRIIMYSVKARVPLEKTDVPRTTYSH
jgi:hypothetical protein